MARDAAEQPDVEQTDQPVTLENVLDAVNRIVQSKAKDRLSEGYWGET